MILQAVRALADRLEDSTYGVGARLAALSVDSGDTAPAAPTIIDETRDDDGAIGRDPVTSGSYLRVTASEVRGLDGQAAQYLHEGDVPVEITVGVKATSPANAVRDLYYILRAVVLSLDTMFATTTTRAGVQVYALLSLSAAQVRAELSDHTATGSVLATVRCRDLEA